MSTARRRPTGGTRRPQVAGRPRSGAAAENEPSPDGAEGRLAVEERPEVRTTPGTARPTGVGRPRTVARPGSRTEADTRDADDTADDTADVTADVVAPAGDDVVENVPGQAPEDSLPAAPAVRSGEADAGSGDPSGSGLAGRVRRIPLPQAPATRRGVAALLAVTILLTAAAVFFAVSWGRLQFSGATSNTALTDVGTTATVSEQVGEAVTKVYSFDHARLDQAESDARAVVTGPFTGQFDQIFGNVRQLAPRQQAVVTATIPKSAVQSIDGDRATVYVFVNQVVRRVDDRGQPQQGTAAARLRVDAVYVDGRWKVAGMTPA